MKKSVKMADVARVAGVSPMTVSRAFKSDASVGKDTRERILRIAEDLGYVFDSTASNFRSQRTGFVATTIPSLNNANFAESISGLTEALAEYGLQVLLGYTDYNTLTEERLIDQLLRRRPEAIVVTGSSHTARGRKLLEASGIPVVEMWDLPADPIGHVVGFSNALAMRPVVDHLVQTGRRRLAFIGGEDKGDTRGADRRRGFLHAAQELALPEPVLVSAGAVPVSMLDGAKAMGHLLDNLMPVDAVICVSDLSAFGAIMECTRRQVRVPEDIAIAGFGAFEISAVCEPTITTINANARRIGWEAGRMLGEALRGDGVVEGPVEISPRLIVAAST